VRELVDEIIVVDTGSTDRTKEIALQLGARVFDFKWVDSFAAARNESLRRATGEWIFWLDADDRLDEANRQKLAVLFDELRHGSEQEETEKTEAFPSLFPLLPPVTFIEAKAGTGSDRETQKGTGSARIG
jgi:glycosyltransferase involved in cell wall biosynthesis